MNYVVSPNHFVLLRGPRNVLMLCGPTEHLHYGKYISAYLDVSYPSLHSIRSIPGESLVSQLFVYMASHVEDIGALEELEVEVLARIFSNHGRGQRYYLAQQD